MVQPAPGAYPSCLEYRDYFNHYADYWHWQFPACFCKSQNCSVQVVVYMLLLPIAAGSVFIFPEVKAKWYI
jgi:hypothetical protein